MILPWKYISIQKWKEKQRYYRKLYELKHVNFSAISLLLSVLLWQTSAFAVTLKCVLSIFIRCWSNQSHSQASLWLGNSAKLPNSKGDFSIKVCQYPIHTQSMWNIWRVLTFLGFLHQNYFVSTRSGRKINLNIQKFKPGRSF